MARQQQPRKPKRYTVRDARSREEFTCYTASTARQKLRQLQDNGRTAYVTPPLPPEHPFFSV